MNRLFIDVREPSEYASGHVEGALNIPPSRIMQGEPTELANVSRDTELIVYCLSGSRSNATIPYLKQFGFTNIINGINKDQVSRKYL